MADRPPLTKLLKKELIWLATHKCQHRHSFLEHYGCYVPSEAPPKIGFLDIETSNLAADFGIILSYCIKEGGSDKIHQAVLTAEDIKKYKPGEEDRGVVLSLLKDLEKFDKIVTYYGKRFDVPYIRSRAVSMGIRFPGYGALDHTDLYFVLRSKFRLSSNRLENACRVLLNKTQKTRIENKYWRGGTRGDAKSLKYILDHNEKDVLDLEKLYDLVIDYSKGSNTSI